MDKRKFYMPTYDHEDNPVIREVELYHNVKQNKAEGEPPMVGGRPGHPLTWEIGCEVALTVSEARELGMKDQAHEIKRLQEQLNRVNKKDWSNAPVRGIGDDQRT